MNVTITNFITGFTNDPCFFLALWHTSITLNQKTPAALLANQMQSQSGEEGSFTHPALQICHVIDG